MAHFCLRFGLLALAGFSLLAALVGGVARLGWDLPLPTADLRTNHGPLMVTGFLGTLICLERAVALKRLWPYGGPLLAALSSLGLLLGLPLPLSQLLAAGAGLFLIAVFALFCWQQPADFLLTMGTGAFLWLGGTALWFAGYPLHQIVPWWTGFLVLTIAGERLELSRLIRLSTFKRAEFFIAVGLFLFGLGVSLFAFDYGVGFCALALIALALWLLRFDIAWRAGRQSGLPRFIAVCLLSGYVWLAIGGCLWLAYAEFFVAGPGYDAMLHTLFVGFVLSMIFAHAPMIFPSITGFAMPFQRWFYLHLGLLHVSLLLRVGGDLLLWSAAQKWGGMFNALTILLFLANNIRSVQAGRSS